MGLLGRRGIHLKAWDTFAQIIGTAAAALIGLLFVAVSIRIASIARSQELRNRAAQTLTLFGTSPYSFGLACDSRSGVPHTRRRVGRSQRDHRCWPPPPRPAREER